MKKLYYNFIVLAGVAIVTLSCQKEPCKKCLEAQARAQVNEVGKTASLVVDVQGLPLNATKGENGAEHHTAVEKKVSQVDIAIYDEDGTLEWSRHFKGEPMSRQFITGLTEGPKTVAVLANYTLDDVPATISAFKENLTSLADNNRENFVMVGVTEGMADTDPEPVILKLARVAAKFSVTGNIITAWESDVPETFAITDIYLANAAVSSDFNFDGSAGPEINMRSTVELVTDSLYNDFTVAAKKDWTEGEPFNGGVNFYSYPNAGDVRTCVMIKALYNGRVTYYPLVIDQPIAHNTLYRIGDITITCEGCENPWDDFTKVKVIFDIEIADWDYKEIYPEYTF